MKLPIILVGLHLITLEVISLLAMKTLLQSQRGCTEDVKNRVRDKEKPKPPQWMLTLQEIISLAMEEYFSLNSAFEWLIPLQLAPSTSLRSGFGKRPQ